ncbi:MAG TPA: murein biosynthesis integral membrane protein MurJ [Bryobacteraceae bacterium]|nr:murein biosynthesis integral membrane protein MurJ [Bryobacteraceae bacterium]
MNVPESVPPPPRAIPAQSPSAREQHHRETLVRSAGIASAAVFLSRITGLVRETVMAQLFGASGVYDAYSLGFRIPNLTRDLFAEGALSSAFVPTFTEYLSTKGKAEAARLANLVMTAVVLIVGVLCVLGMVFSPALVSVLASGWKEDPEKFALAVRMTRIMFPFLLLIALSAQAMGMLNASGVFGVPALASMWFNIGSVVVGLLLGAVAGPWIGISTVEGMAYGVVAGGFLQLISQAPSLRRTGFHLHPALDFSDPGLRRIFGLMGPAIIGNAAVQVNVAVNTNFASMVIDPLRGADGPVSWLQYAFRFMQLPLGLFGVAIASATLPAISRAAASKDIDQFRRTLAHSLGTVFLMTVPSSVGLAILGESVIGLIYQGRRFNAYDTHQTAVALSAYVVGLAGYSAVKVLAPAFYTLGTARTPMLVSVTSILINLGVAWTMTRQFGMGHVGLALATSGVALFNALALLWLIRGKLGGIHGRALLESTLKIAAASAVMAVAIWMSNKLIVDTFGTGRIGRLTDVAVSIPLGIAVFYTGCRLLHVAELETAVRAVAGPLARSRAGRVLKSGSNGR